MNTRFIFYSSHKKLIEFLQSKSNKSDFVENVMIDFINGDLIKITESEIDMKIKQEKLLKLIAERKIKEWQALHLDIFDKPPSSAADKAIKEKSNLEKFKLDAEKLKVHFTISKDTFTPTVLNVFCLKCGEKFYCSEDELNTVIIKHSSHLHGDWLKND